jgi:hypothetical protein
MLEIGPFSKSFWRNASPLLIGWCNSFSSTSFGIGTSCACSSTIGCYNSPSSTSLDTWTDCEIPSTTGWGIISISSSESKITMTYGTNFAIDALVLISRNFGFCDCFLQLKFSCMRHMQLQICVVAHDIQLHVTLRMQHVYTVLIYMFIHTYKSKCSCTLCATLLATTMQLIKIWHMFKN